MHKSSEPKLPITPTVDRTVALFLAALLLSTAGAAVMLGLSWQEDRGMWSLMEGVFMSLFLFALGSALLLTVRARAVVAPTSIRPWMRPAAMAVVIFGIAIAGSTFWRWRA